MPEHPAPRNSLYSTDSTTTYASTLSSLTSSLGLTESPLPPAKKTMAVLEVVRDQSEDYRRQAMLRGQKSRGDLKAGGGGVTQRVRSFENIGKEGGAQPIMVVNSPSPARRSTLAPPADGQQREAKPKRPSSQLKTQHYSAQARAGDAPQPTRTRPAPPQVKVTAVTSPPPAKQQPSKSQIAIPVRRAPPANARSLRPPPAGQPPASPAHTDDSMSEDWDAELRRDAQNINLQLRPQTSTAVVRQPSREVMAVKSGKDEWEMAAMRIDRRETGRDAEERVRRDPTREIAYPPAMPRLAIRAAPTGVTSIHVGVRPRIHPTRTEESLSRNQPDTNLPEPLFSPNPSNAPLASPSDNGTAADDDGTVRGSYGNRYKGELAERAQKEYEEWLSKKAEREGMRDEDGGLRGTQEWEPRERTRARFGELNQPVSPHPDTNYATAKMGGAYGYGQSPGHEMGYGYTGHPFPQQQQVVPAMIQAKGQEMGPGDGQMQGYEGYDQNGYPYNQQQGYWDPMAYWWAMTQMQMQMQGISMEDIQAYGMGMGMQGMGFQGEEVSPITSEESSQGSSDDGQPPRIHFAPSPKKDKGRLKHQPSELDIYQQQLQQQQQLYQQQYGQEAYDA